MINWKYGNPCFFLNLSIYDDPKVEVGYNPVTELFDVG